MSSNEYHLLTFDAGARATGWTWFVVDFHAFSRPENNWLDYVKSWDCGEFTGPEVQIVKQCVGLVHGAYNLVSYLNMQVVCEDFDLTQLIGGKNLLSPVRINSVIGWECYKVAVKCDLQNRALRTSVTRSRLAAWGFEGRFKKDEFAAMQHAVTWLRRLKKESKSRPWKLSSRDVLNAYWDCSCRNGGRHDLVHAT